MLFRSQLGIAALAFESANRHLPNSGGYDYSVGNNNTPYTTPNAFTTIPGYGAFRPRWGNPNAQPSKQLGGTCYSLLPYLEQESLFKDPLLCFSTAVKTLHMPSRRAAVAKTVPATDSVYPGYSYNDAGLGASARSDARSRTLGRPNPRSSHARSRAHVRTRNRSARSGAHYSVTSSSTMLTYTSKPRSVPTSSFSPFIIT